MEICVPVSIFLLLCFDSTLAIAPPAILFLGSIPSGFRLSLAHVGRSLLGPHFFATVCRHCLPHVPNPLVPLLIKADPNRELHSPPSFFLSSPRKLRSERSSRTPPHPHRISTNVRRILTAAFFSSNMVKEATSRPRFLPFFFFPSSLRKDS